MKLRRHTENKRPVRAREAAGQAELGPQLEFDPHKDIPKTNRDIYRSALLPEPGFKKAELDLSMYLLMFPEDRDVLLNGHSQEGSVRTITEYLEQILLFPEKIADIKRQIEELGRIKEECSEPSPTKKVRAMVLAQLAFPVETAAEKEFFDFEWTLVKKNYEAYRSSKDTRTAALMLAWMRIANQDKFSSIEGIDQEKKIFRLALEQELLKERRRPETKRTNSLTVAFALYVLSVDRVGIVPGKGIVVVAEQKRLGQPAPLPDRPHM